MGKANNIFYYGKEDPLPEQIKLKAGSLEMVYTEGDLRYIKLGNTEILRAINMSCRDRYWTTVIPLISNVQIDKKPNSFHITYNAENRQGDVNFVWKGEITGNDRGTIKFLMQGKANATFMKNRIGFCVLHPVKECAGRACIIENEKGVVEGMFPKDISPDPVFTDIKTVSYQVEPDLWARVRFSGGNFEMEDQRNWTDDSFKSYCPSIALPVPVEIKKGTKISQSVTLSLKGQIPRLQPKTSDKNITLSIGSIPVCKFPRIGLGMSSTDQLLTPNESTRLRALNLSHLRVDLYLSHSDYKKKLYQAITGAKEVDVSLEVALHLTDEAENELKGLVNTLELSLFQEENPAICTWLVFNTNEKCTTEKTIKLARKHLKYYDPSALIGGGTNIYFSQLRGCSSLAGGMDIVSYSINPQTHVFDNDSMVETLGGQAFTIDNAHKYITNLPLAISPVTMKPRFKPTRIGPALKPLSGELPEQVDERQMSLFGAAWTAGSLKYISASNVYSITYYETIGWRGVMEAESGSPLPEKFHSSPGSVFPLYHVLADVGEFVGGYVLPIKSSNTLKVNGMAVYKEGKILLIIANFGYEYVRVIVQNVNKFVYVKYLNEKNVKEAMQSPECFRMIKGTRLHPCKGIIKLNLLPYSIARIDFESKTDLDVESFVKDIM